MPQKETETYYPTSPQDWRQWLEENHTSKQCVWLIYYRVSSDKPSLTWSEAVDEALCFGWIDSTKKTIDDESYMQYFGKRKANSTWSKINKDKIDRLIKTKKMAESGYKSIEVAKQNGMWWLMDDIEKGIIPDDLNSALNEEKVAGEFFQSQTKSIKKGLMFWVVSAKRNETRQKRISEIVRSLSECELPKNFR